MGQQQAFREEFDEHRQSQQQARGHQEELEASFRASWGGGCVGSPLAPSELYGYIKEHGWPSNVAVADASLEEAASLPDWTLPFEHEAFPVWGIDRLPRGGRHFSERKREYDLIEQGVFHFLQHLERTKADSGDVMVLVEGKSWGTTPRGGRYLWSQE